ncbi:MAG: antirestriction protein [Candidatus Nealsonbacteria bacterium]|nr:antirestriction protein [Candidatus Nealsonbacteria bacterium]
MTFYKKAESAATLILEAFRTGNLPRALAPVFVHRKDNVPCRAWSWSNQLLAALSGTSDARGYRQWEQVGRHVKKGSKSFPILCPCVRKFEDKETGEEKRALYGFTSAPVFRLEDTDGASLPGPDPETLAWLESLPLRDVAESWGVSVDCFNGQSARYQGYYKHGEAIALGVKNLSTWAHELIHAADDRNKTITRAPGQQPDNEIVAELGGAILLEVLGHDTESDRGGCWEYVKAYADKAGKDTGAACRALLKRTCDCVALILDSAEELHHAASEGIVAA